MVYSPSEVKRMLKPRLEVKSLDYVKYFDQSNQVNLELKIVSKSFNGMPIIDRERVVHKLLKIDFDTIHSVVLQCESDFEQ